MSSIDSTGEMTTPTPPEDNEALSDAFFETHLKPTAESLRKRSVEFFGLAPDAKEKSYYVDRTNDGAPALVSIESGDVVASLSAMWTEQGLPELVELAGPLVDLAGKMIPDDDSDDVSPFIYAMF